MNGVRRLVEIFSKEGDLVLDPFMGSGTTGVACRETNRRFIGFDEDIKAVNIAEKRISKTSYRFQGKLFEIDNDSKV